MKSTHPGKSGTLIKLLKKMIIYPLSIIAGYLAIGYFLHSVVFPVEIPDLKTYFKAGSQISSAAEGVRQTIVKQEDGFVHCSVEIFGYADGPPAHIHYGFDETFEVENGVLSIWIDGEVKKLVPGEQLHVPAGLPHKPFNETADTIRMKGTAAFPEKFAFGLFQIYGLMDQHPDFGKMPHTLFMLAPLHQAGFDSYLAEGPPVFLQKATSFLLTPAARLMGYKCYYEEFDLLN